MGFSEKLAALRRGAGMSQEQLADRLGVTRQSVSKWEGGAAAPELGKLVALSELFHVSVDYLVKDYLEEPEPPAEEGAASRLEAQMEGLSRYFRTWEWNSRTKLFGLPLVSVCFHAYPRAFRSHRAAKGIIAVGNVAVGVLAIGACSVGVVSVGALSAGLLALGAVALGAAALGAVAVGLLAFGLTAVGLWYAGGLTAVAGKIAVGLAAVGDTAVGLDAQGNHVLLWGGGLTRAQVEAFLTERHPDLWRPLLRLLADLGANIK